jgi:hypothetical protein
MELYDTSLAPYQRIRSGYYITATPVEEQRTFAVCPNPGWSKTGNYPPALNGNKIVMVDYVVPRFRSRQAAGERFFNNMFKEEVTVSTVGGGVETTAIPKACYPTYQDAHARWKSVGGPVIQVWIPKDAIADSHGNQLPTISTVLSDAEITRVQKIVSTEVLSKRGTADSDLWESAAEYRQTLSMLESPVSRLKDLSKRLLQSAEKGTFSRNLVKEVSDGYLMYRYGISPLMKDIKNILASLNKAGGKKEVTSRAKEQLTVASVIGGIANDGLNLVNWSNQISDAVTVRAMSLDEGHVSFANNLGFSFRGLAMLPLQLTSYSFVADWFSNLGSYVQNTIPAFGWNQLGSCMVTTRVTANAYRIVSSSNLLPSTYTIDQGPNGSIGIIRVTTTRSALMPASFEVVSDFKFDTGKRVGDALALIAGRFVKLSNLIGYRPNNSAFHDRKAYHNWAETLNNSKQFT